jgi:hypothetical protein
MRNVVGIININLWSRYFIQSFGSCHTHYWDIDGICDHLGHSWEIVIFIHGKIYSWDFHISNETTMSVRERHKAWLVFAQLIDTIDYDIRQRDHVPTASYNFLARIQSHELETALKISTWAKGNRSFGASDLTVSGSIFLMNLAILTDLQTKMFLEILCLS